MTDNEEDSTLLPCAQKLAFDTQKAAQATATVAGYRHGTKLKVYLCRSCLLWHIATDLGEG